MLLRTERQAEHSRVPSFLEKTLVALYRKVEFFDLLLFIYIASIVRQYMWVVDQNGLAWMLTLAVAAFICGLHVAHREESAYTLSPRFLLVVGLPLLLVYVMRAPFPDQDFDVMNYHLVYSERALDGWPFIHGDFFPTVLQVNPAPDLVFGIFRYALGYRLATIANLFALIWTATIADRFLRPYIKNEWLRCTGALFVVSTEYILYLLNDCRIDLLAVPLLLEATYLALRFSELKRKSHTLLHIALFLSISAAFKLSNLAFVVPVALVCIMKVFRHWSELDKKYIGLTIVALIAPLLPFSLYMYWQTGNPVFPFYNKIFKSPYAPLTNYSDPMFGPDTFLETILWPVWSFFNPERISELSGIGLPYTGRISLGFVVCILCLFYKLLGKEIRALCLLTLVNCLLWSVMSGNVRYGLYLEVLAGITILSLFSALYLSARSTGKHLSREMIMFVVLFGTLLLIQPVASYRVISWHSPVLWNKTTQPSIFEDFDGYVAESRNFLSDYEADKYLPPEQREMFDKVEVWINSYYTTSGVEIALKPDVPMLAVCDYLTSIDYLPHEASQQLFAEKLSQVRGKRMYSLALINYNLMRESFEAITRVGLSIGEITPVDIPFYSQRTRRKMLLIEVLPPGQGIDKNGVEVLVKKFRYLWEEEKRLQESEKRH